MIRTYDVNPAGDYVEAGDYARLATLAQRAADEIAREITARHDEIVAGWVALRAQRERVPA